MKWANKDYAHLLGRGVVVFPKRGDSIEERLLTVGINTNGLWVRTPGDSVLIPWEDVKQALDGDICHIGGTVRRVAGQIGLSNGHLSLAATELGQKKDFQKALGQA